ncbi:MAG TPA: 50S ribosomal protein L32 [Gammaproteobacteria bacterium]|nr:50S ribosomal protein L32 [Gammaproteobacteria bacterium]
MAVPKKKTSKTRRDQRRAHHGIRPDSLSTCPECGERKRPHHVCQGCGTYRDRQVLAATEED